MTASDLQKETMLFKVLFSHLKGFQDVRCSDMPKEKRKQRNEKM